jgi:UDP-GlcNAc:undecaprenyl-phosphate GlcNAc-1-phosphate transferase
MLDYAKYLDVLPNILLGFITAILLVPVLRQIGLKYGFSTQPRELLSPTDRNYITRENETVMSRLGEFGMLIPLAIFLWKDLSLDIQLFGIVLTIAMIGLLGVFDAKHNLNEFIKLYVLVFAGILLVFTGTVININDLIDVSKIDILINNPVTNTSLSLISSLVTIGWVVVIPYALSLVGGVDGLSEGTSLIAMIILTLIGIRHGSLITVTIGSLCLGGLLGVLPYNFHPAMIYSEHLIYGFIIAILSITSQAKVSTSILLLTVPLIDFIIVHYYRAKKYFDENEKFNLKVLLHYFGTGDRNHFHHKLKDLGFSPIKIAILQYIMYAVLGFIALMVSGLYLTVSIVSSVAVIVLIFYYIHKKVSHV